MKSYFEMVKEFHVAFGHPVADKAGFASDELMDFRERFNAQRFIVDVEKKYTSTRG